MSCRTNVQLANVLLNKWGSPELIMSLGASKPQMTKNFKNEVKIPGVEDLTEASKIQLDFFVVFLALLK